MRNRAANLFFISSLISNPGNLRIRRYAEGYLLSVPPIALLISGNIPEEDIRQAIKEEAPRRIAGYPRADIEGYEIRERKTMILFRDGFTKRGSGARILRTRGEHSALVSLLERHGMAPALDAEELSSRPFPSEAAGFFEGRKLVSCAYTCFESTLAAMIVGVLTDTGYRRRGYAAAVLSELIDVLFNEDSLEYIVLWYESPESRRLYESLGFRTAESFIYHSKT